MLLMSFLGWSNLVRITAYITCTPVLWQFLYKLPVSVEQISF